MKYRFGWPFGRLALTDDAIVLSVRGPLGRLFSLLTRRTSPSLPLVLPLAEITGVDVWGGRPTVISFDCRNPEVDGVLFGSLRAPRALLAALVERGIAVRETAA
jgi:hypothetical protein